MIGQDIVIFKRKIENYVGKSMQKRTKTERNFEETQKCNKKKTKQNIKMSNANQTQIGISIKQSHISLPTNLRHQSMKPRGFFTTNAVFLCVTMDICTIYKYSKMKSKMRAKVQLLVKHRKVYA